MSFRDEISPDVKPGDDFFRFVNEKWLDEHPMPDNKARYGAFSVLTDENRERLRVLLEKDGGGEGDSVNITLLRQFYRSAMDEAAVEQAGLEAVQPVLEAIGRIGRADEVRQFIIDRQAQGLEMVWAASVEPDDKNSRRYVLRFHQDGLGLPDRDYYLEDGERFETIRAKYREFLTDLFRLVGGMEPEKQAERVVAIELELARASSTATERRDSEKMYHLYRLEQLGAELPGFDWAAYLEQTGLPTVKEVVVSQPEFMKVALEQLDKQPVEAWQSYFTFHTLMPVLSKLPKAYEDLWFGFYLRVLAGTKELEPRYRRMIQLSERVLPEPTGQLFVQAHFDENAKQAIYELVGYVQEALRERIGGLSWMSEPTKAKALEKLGTFLPLLGYPDKWRDYSGLKLGTNFAANFLAVVAFEWRRDTARIDQPVDRKEWLMSPALVNAYYWPSTNGITFPAGILQPPFFDATGDFAENYGSIGAVIGHEIIHGFDDEGSKFDKDGNLQPWWEAEDRRRFDALAVKLEEQFNQYEIHGRKVNGKLTLGENIADLGGILVAFDALRQKLAESGERAMVDGFTPEQRFFLSFARSWRENIRPELALQYLVMDPHSPDVLRTNGVVPNVDAFYEAFDVQPGDKLYRELGDRVRIW